MKTITFAIDGMTCGHCVATVRSTLARIPDLHVAGVTLGAATVHLSASPTDAQRTIDAALAALADAGYPAAIADGTPSPAAPSMGGSCCAPAALASQPVIRSH